MQVISYKVLFELRILHDYYLSDNLGKSFYELSDAAQNALLVNKLRDQQYDISRDLDILMSPVDKAVFDNFHLKMVKTPAGFYIGAEVGAPVIINGKERFSLKIKPPENIQFTFGLAISSSLFTGITNVRLDKVAPSIYFFSNKGNHTGNSLSAPVKPITGGITYEMGDLALIGNAVHQATERNQGNRSKWLPVGGNGFVHQTDRSVSTEDPWFAQWLKTFRPVQRPPLGIIQIGLRSETPGMSLIDDNGFLPGITSPNLKHPVLEIRFMSRSTYWQYQKQEGFTTDEKTRIDRNAGTLLDFKNGKYISKIPQRFVVSRPPLGTASFRLPNALPGSFRSENGRLVSEVNFSINTPVP